MRQGERLLSPVGEGGRSRFLPSDWLRRGATAARWARGEDEPDSRLRGQQGQPERLLAVFLAFCLISSDMLVICGIDV